MVTLYITRHGETLENASGILQGHLAGHLSPKGFEQARQLRDKLAKIPFNAIVVSDLQRTIDTANILNEPHGLELCLTSLLRERDWGEFTGTKISSIRVSPQDFPESVENPDQLQKRARAFLNYILEKYPNQTVLAVGHGYFDRCILAEFYQTAPHDIPRWDNAEVRMIQLEKLNAPQHSISDNEISAD